MSQAKDTTYQVRILPALHHIQDKFGYLDKDELKKFSDKSEIPLYRLQAVASFFPHFRFEKPPRVRMRVCRDMACHMAGAGQVLEELGEIAASDLAVEGVSCLGRCDRAPAACVAVSLKAEEAKARDAHEATLELYYFGRTSTDLTRIAAECVAGNPPPSDLDASQPSKAAGWAIDIYGGKPAEYHAVRKAVALRDASLDKAASILKQRFQWFPDKIQDFIEIAKIGRPAQEVEEAVMEAVLKWQTEDDWAAGPEVGGWAGTILQELDAARADLRGLGGAGIPATQKWRDVRDAVRNARRRQQDDRAFIVVNGDESEPGTFKDRELLLRTPHTVIEGVILAGLITEASQGFIYIRHEYPEQIKACEEEIKRAEALGMCGPEAHLLGRPFPVSVFVSPGGYICGEQSALIEAMSDNRGEPRNLPPKLETNGLDDQPTLVSNVETFAWVPYIWHNGGESYAKMGVNGWRGKRFFSISGDVERPGAYEVPMGMTLRELIMNPEYCGGIKGGRKFKGFAPSGPSGGFLPAKLTAKAGLPRKHTENKSWIELAKRRGIDPGVAEIDLLDLELELNLFRALSPTQALGAGLVVYSDARDMAEQAVNALEFFRNESCGKCVPCRLGSQKLAAMGKNLLQKKIPSAHWKEVLLPLVRELGDAMVLTSICGLGRSVPMPLRTAMDFFGDDLAPYFPGSAKADAGS